MPTSPKQTQKTPDGAEPGDQELKTYRSLSIPVLAGTLVCVLVGGAGLYFWHAYQVRRGASTLLTRAEQLISDAEEKNAKAAYSDAASLIYRYTQIQPDDPDGQIRLAEVYEKSVTDARKGERAISLLYEAVGVADQTKQQQLRRSLVELLLKQRQFLEAETQAGKLTPDADDADAVFQAARLAALALFGRYQTGGIPGQELPSAITTLVAKLRAATAIQMDPQLAEILAFLLRNDDPQLVIYPPGGQATAPQATGPADDTGKSGPGETDSQVTSTPNPMSQPDRAAEATQLMDRLVEQCGDDPLAWLVRSNYREVHEEDLPGAAADLDQALKIGGDQLQVRLAGATSAYAAAREIMTKNDLAELPQPGTEQGDVSADRRAAIDAARAQFEKAIEHYQYVLDHIEPKSQIAILGLGRAAISLGQPDKAVDIWKDALKEPDEDTFAIRYYLTQQLINLQDFATATGHLALLDQEIENLNVRQDRAQFEPLRRSIRLMHARVLVGEQKYAEALRTLELAAAGQPSSPYEATEYFRAYRLTGTCHEQAGRPDLAAQSYEKAAEIAPSATEQALARLSAAAAWETAGATDNAIADCQRAINLRPDPEAYLMLARLLLTKQGMSPPSERAPVWNQFNEALAKLHDSATTGQLNAAWRRDLLAAEARVLQAADDQQTAEAEAALYETARRAEDQYPTDEALIRQLVFLYQGLEKPADADRALTNFQSLTTDAVARPLVQASLEYERKQYEAALATLQQMGQDLPPAARIAVEKTKAQIASATGNLAQAADVLKKLAADYPADLSVARMRMQVVEQMNDPAAREQLENELLGGDQEDKSWALAMKIRRLLAEATAVHDARFMESANLLARLETARPGWSVVASLHGETAEKRAAFAGTPEQQRINFEDAARAYERAIALGERAVGVHERLVSSLYQAGRLNEAGTWLAKLDSVVPRSNTLSEIAINIALQEKRQEQALEFARRAVAQRADDVMAKVQLGLLLQTANQTAEAEQLLVDAVKAAPQDERAWSGLFTYYVRTRDKDKARATLLQMTQQANMPKPRQAFVLAQGYEALGDDPNAEQAYRDAISLAPDDVKVWLRLANFYVARLEIPNSDNQKKAIDTLREVVKRDPDSGPPKRMLAMLLAGEGGGQFASAVEMLSADGGRESSPADDLRIKGILLFQRGGDAELQQAREIFEGLVESLDSDPNDRLLLARILERQADVAAARAQLARAAGQTPPNIRALATFVDFLLRHNDLEEAQRWLQTLADARKPAFDLGVLELQARLLIAQGSPDKVQQLIDPPSLQQLATLEDGEATARTEFLGNVGNIFTVLELHALAEPWYRRLVEADPARFDQLAICVARQNRIPEALDVCQNAAAHVDAGIVCQTVANVLTSGSPTEADYERAEPILAAAEQQFADNAVVLQRISNVRILQGKLDDAIRLLKKTVELEPKNVLALNNLAVTMSEQPGLRSQAIEYVDRAIEITGPRPDLYDTKASIYIYDGQPAQAIELLKFAVRTTKHDPRYQFHLAAAYWGCDNKEEAARYLREAMKAGLESQILTQADRQLMADMKHLLETTTPGDSQ